MRKLKSCPFCGGDPIVITPESKFQPPIINSEYHRKMYVVGCSACGNIGFIFKVLNDVDRETTEKMIANKWNRRYNKVD